MLAKHRNMLNCSVDLAQVASFSAVRAHRITVCRVRARAMLLDRFAVRGSILANLASG